MKVLVTGATGFVGFHCVKKLLANGHDVRLLVRSPDKLPGIYSPHGIDITDYVVGDMAETAAVDKALAGVDAVIHAAASIIGDERVGDVNVAGVRNVVGGAVEAGIDPIIYISSIGCMFPPPGDVLTVDDPLTGLDSMYGRSKVAGEKLVRGYQDAGASIVTLYPAGVFGPEDPALGELHKGVRDALKLAFPVTTGGNSLIDVRDLAEITLQCLKPAMGARRYVVGGRFVTWDEFADLVSDAIDRPVRKLRISRQAMLAFGTAMDWTRKLIPFDFPVTHEAARYMVDHTPCDSRPVCDEFGLTFRPTAETIEDSLRWLYRAGHLPARLAGRLADG